MEHLISYCIALLSNLNNFMNMVSALYFPAGNFLPPSRTPNSSPFVLKDGVLYLVYDSRCA